MYNRNKNNKSEEKDGTLECKDSEEDKMINHNINDLCRKYVHEVRNMKILDKEMINNIRDMSNEDKMEIIIAFNDIIENINILIE